MIRPSDGGPCPICGAEMDGKDYPNDSIFPVLNKKYPTVRGRYYHMRNEHNRFEDYDWSDEDSGILEVPND